MDWREDGSSQERRGVFPAPTVGTKSLSQWHVRDLGPQGPSASHGRTAGTRPVTADELAVLQGFPSGFPWQGTQTEIGRQIGNAIPPTLARAVLASLLLNEAP
jgi:DNA (cytosine-5)-methyltransferase 1